MNLRAWTWTCLICLLAPLAVMAWPTTNRTFTVDLAWDASEDEAATGYVVYVSTNSFYGPQGGLPLVRQVNVPGKTNLTATVTSLVPGQRYHFVVTAHDDLGMESGFSNEVFWDAPRIPGAPRLRLVVQGVLGSAPRIEAPWEATVVFPQYLARVDDATAMFIRARRDYREGRESRPGVETRGG
jgi:hypothetical protein